MWNFFDKTLFLNKVERTDRLNDCLNELTRVGLKADPFYSINAEQYAQRISFDGWKNILRSGG
jgi:hypothetical protein